MPQAVQDWLKTHVKAMDQRSVEELGHTLFFRDELRGTIVDDHYFSSPADGVVIFSKVVEPGQPIVEIKGMFYTLKDVLGFDIQQPCLTIGIFMTFYDVHINRMPMSGFLTYKKLDPIQSYNRPMFMVEESLKENDLATSHTHMDYVFHNERMLNTIYNPKLDYTYYVTQIADEDVDLIVPFYRTQSMLQQNMRYSMIRWGSQCELILPITPQFSFKSLVSDMLHVKAGIDRLVQIV